MKTILVDAVDTFIIEGHGVFQEMYDLLETFPNRKIVVSNVNDDEAIEFGVDKSPYEVFSLKHNPNKTDPKFFEQLFEHFNLTKDDVIYFEHNPEAVKSAESIGITSYYYDSEKKDLTALKEFLNKELLTD